MLTRRYYYRTTISIVALVLVLAIGLAVISTSRARAAEHAAEVQARDEQISQLKEQLTNLTRLVEALSGSSQYILVLRIDQEAFFGMATVHSTIIQLPVDRSFYDCLCRGQDITDMPQIRLLSSSIATNVRVYVDDMYVIDR